MSSNLPVLEAPETVQSDIRSPLLVHSSDSSQRVVQLDARINKWSLSAGKRLFDIAFSTGILIVFSVPMLVIALCIRLTSQGKAIFVQKRVGKHGRLFSIYKFRTMTEARAGKGVGLTRTGDRRVTPVGRVLRKLKLDELPQFYNILRGDMSVVGPRPKLPQYSDKLDFPYRPGITGAATLAFRHEEQILANVPATELESFYQESIKPMKANIDSRYMRMATLRSDIHILLTTIFASLMPQFYAALEHHDFHPSPVQSSSETGSFE